VFIFKLQDTTNWSLGPFIAIVGAVAQMFSALFLGVNIRCYEEKVETEV
jgi:hypothetical protein